MNRARLGLRGALPLAFVLPTVGLLLPASLHSSLSASPSLRDTRAAVGQLVTGPSAPVRGVLFTGVGPGGAMARAFHLDGATTASFSAYPAGFTGGASSWAGAT